MRWNTVRTGGSLAVAGIGALVAIVALAAADASPRSYLPKKCSALLGTDISADYPEIGTGTTLKLSRDKKWHDEDDLDYGKWVGVVQNIGGEASKVFPDLTGDGDVGCLKVIREQVGGIAILKPDKGRARQMDFVYCEHPTKHINPIPRLGYFETDCSDVTTTVNSRYGLLSVRIPAAGQPLDSTRVATAFDRAIRERVGAVVFNADSTAITAEAARLRDRMLAYGAWWPCSLFGCCRAY